MIELRRRERRGPDWIGPEVRLAPRTVARILAPSNVPYLRELDPINGAVIRASKTTALRYERERPGELVHVKKLGRIPHGGGWKVHGGRAMGSSGARKLTVVADYVHSLVDDHTDWPTPRSCPTRRAPPARRSWPS